MLIYKDTYNMTSTVCTQQAKRSTLPSYNFIFYYRNPWVILQYLVYEYEAFKMSQIKHIFQELLNFSSNLQFISSVDTFIRRLSFVTAPHTYGIKLSLTIYNLRINRNSTSSEAFSIHVAI